MTHFLSSRSRSRLRHRAATLSHAALCVFAAGLLASPLLAQTRPHGGMLRFPDVSQDKIVFLYADDLWVVDKQGGQATPLASPAGQETFPRFNADGQTIAFVGNYDGDTDLYTIPVGGGIATRITYQSANEQLCDWTPSGKLLYSTNGYAGLGRQLQLYEVSEKEPMPQQLPVPYGSNGAISPDGKWLAYTPHSRDFRTWKRYRGGMASDIWLFNLQNKQSKQMTDWEGTDSFPMWHGQTVYYLSDQGPEHRLNIWAYDTTTGARRQVTKFNSFDCKFPAIGPEEIVFQNGASLYLLDLDSEEANTVDVTIPGDRPKLRDQRIDAAEFIQGATLSPTAKRIAVEARGEIWTAPVKNGTPRNLTRTDGVAERYPSWSPDGRWIAYLSDMTGEYELYVTQSDGQGETKRLTDNGEHFRYSPQWSPDSQKIIFADKAGALFLYAFETQELQEIDREPSGSPITVNWSHNSQWITYAKSLGGRAPKTAIFVCDTESGDKHQLTNGFFADSSPVFGPQGDYLYFTSSRDFNGPKYEDLGTTWIYSGTEVLLAMPLRNDVKRWMLPKSDEETWEEPQDEKPEDKESPEESKSDESDAADDSESSPSDQEEATAKDEAEPADEEGKAAEKKDEDKKSDDHFAIEPEGAEQRAFQLPVSNGNFGSVAVNAKGHLIYARRAGRGDRTPPSIKYLDPSADEPKEATVVEGAASFEISAKGDKLLVLRGSQAYVIAAAPNQKLTARVSTDGMQMLVSPRAEWEQIFMDAWRMERDFFYDPTMHGVDWVAVREHYRKMLDDCVSRRDVGFVIGEMISELNVGHAYYRSGDVENAETVPVGTLACEFKLVDGAFQISELYQGAAWDVDARNPLAAVGVREGEFLLAVNRIPMDTTRDPFANFQGLAGQVVTLTVSDQAKGGAEREVVVQLLRSDSQHRYRHWIEKNRQYVAEKTDGRVGYIYVPNTGIDGQNDLVRQFYGQMNKEALIIDERWNGGGQIPTRFIELLNRPVTNYWARRDGTDWTWPPDSHQGPKCMLINGMAGSGGDMFPALFRQAGLGKLIGMRTWGGLVGITGGPSLIDGASVTAPSFAYYEKDGTWGIEGHGVDPDIEVVDDPALMVDGQDPQLDAAIDQMLQELEQNPYVKPERPAYPDRSQFGIAEEDK